MPGASALTPSRLLSAVNGASDSAPSGPERNRQLKDLNEKNFQRGGGLRPRVTACAMHASAALPRVTIGNEH